MPESSSLDSSEKMWADTYAPQVIWAQMNGKQLIDLGEQLLGDLRIILKSQLREDNSQGAVLFVPSRWISLTARFIRSFDQALHDLRIPTTLRIVAHLQKEQQKPSVGTLSSLSFEGKNPKEKVFRQNVLHQI